MSFGVQMQTFYGTSGEFRIESERGEVVARYVQTRIRAALDGQWDSILANSMRPWREIFAAERMSFDELLQRDLDDARVANDLIPYLMGTESSRYPVFPPILAVLAPKLRGTSGIERFYPNPTSVPGSTATAFGNIFEVGPYMVDGQPSPIAQVRYNEHRSAFVIVDGQHRAMALLALFRQLQGSSAWESSPYATYYSHFSPKEEQVSHIQLPVCVLYFPEVYEGSEEQARTDADLVSICRQIFLDVNKQAKPVSAARELLLDDTKFPALLMRRVLTKLREAGSTPSRSQICAFDYGRDDLSDFDRVVVTTPTEYSSSHALHIAIGSLCFANPDALTLHSTKDVTDGRLRRNSERPVKLLRGKTERPYISTHHAGLWTKKESSATADHLAALWYEVLPGMFDRLRPYRVHNEQLFQLRKQLETPAARANSALNEARGLIFEGSGGRLVFERHIQRLKEIQDFGLYNDFRTEEVVASNLEHCRTVESALQQQFKLFTRSRAYAYWSIDPDAFEIGSDEDKEVLRKSRVIFDAFGTQAFQLGYVMLVATLVERMLEHQEEATYGDNCAVIRFVARMTAKAIDAYFSPSEPTIRRSTNTGYFAEARANVFHTSEYGLRGLFNAGRSSELNERAWRFFRYALAEILFSDYGLDVQASAIDEDQDLGPLYYDAVDELLTELGSARTYWTTRYVTQGTRSNDFQMELEQKVAEARGQGNDDEAIVVLRDKLMSEKEVDLRGEARQHLKKSLKKLRDPSAIKERLDELVAEAEADLDE